MTFLLDTHVWLWMLREPEKLSEVALGLIDDSRNQLLLSAASTWEIAIKYSLNRLPLSEPPEVSVPGWMRESGVQGLGITHAHAMRVGAMQFHHRDPFDRLLVAQAQIEAIPILTADPVFHRYDVEVVSAAG